MQREDDAQPYGVRKWVQLFLAGRPDLDRGVRGLK